MVGQVVFRDIAKPEWDDYISMAFMRYTPDSNWSFRLGRLSPNLFTITEYRNINVAYTWANVPTEVYGIIPYLYYDGGDVTYSTRINDAVLKTKFYLGWSDSTITADSQSENIALENMVGTSLIYDKNDWNLQARYTQGKLSDESSAISELHRQIALIPEVIWPNKESFISDYSIKNKLAKYLSFSGQKYLGDWLFGFELAKVNSESEVISDLKVDM